MIFYIWGRYIFRIPDNKRLQTKVNENKLLPTD
jgi:hypothetical protein